MNPLIVTTITRQAKGLEAKVEAGILSRENVQDILGILANSATKMIKMPYESWMTFVNIINESREVQKLIDAEEAS